MRPYVLSLPSHLRLRLVDTVSWRWPISPVGATSTKASTNVIRVWTVGSPHTGALPPAVVPLELRQRAEGLGYTVEVEAFRASGFTAKFRDALQNHNELEIL